jgi:hypothetical protein
MIFPITSENDLLMMDEKDYREHMLLSSLDEKLFDNSCHTTLSNSTSTLMNEDAMDETEEFLNDSDPIVSNNTTETDKKSVVKSEPAVVKDEPYEASEDVAVPSKFDILCGQSRICANHTGNRRFQVILDIYAQKYDGSSSKQEKMSLTKEIVACIQESGGRFLKYQDGVWTEISDVTARDKVSHALRTKVSSWKRQKAQAEQDKADGKPPSPTKTRPTHRRKPSHRRRRSSCSIATSASDIAISSFDSNNSASSSVMDELLRNQREIFASLTKTEHGDVHPLKRK